jgi:hypothetical protein
VAGFQLSTEAEIQEKTIRLLARLLRLHVDQAVASDQEARDE